MTISASIKGRAFISYGYWILMHNFVEYSCCWFGSFHFDTIDRSARRKSTTLSILFLPQTDTNDRNAYQYRIEFHQSTFFDKSSTWRSEIWFKYADMDVFRTILNSINSLHKPQKLHVISITFAYCLWPFLGTKHRLSQERGHQIDTPH